MSRLAETLERIDSIARDPRGARIENRGSRIKNSAQPSALSYFRSSIFYPRSSIFYFLSSALAALGLAGIVTVSVSVTQQKETKADLHVAQEDLRAQVQALWRRGQAAVKQGDLATAEAIYRQLTQLDSQSPDWYNNLGVIYVRQSKLKQGVEAFRAALQLAPYYAEAHMNLAVALEGLGEKGEALSHSRAFAALSGEEPKGLGETTRTIQFESRR